MPDIFADAIWLTTPWPQDSATKPRRNPIFRKVVDIPEATTSAVIHICGLGHYELYVNGKRVGDRMLEPAFTAYDKRVHYTTYDIKPLLQKGKNVFSLYLGRGRYNMNTVSVWGFEKSPWRGPCRFVTAGEIKITDGKNIALDAAGWKCADGPIYRDSMYGGEGFDARLEPTGWQTSGFDDSRWDAAKPIDAPAGKLLPTDFAPIRIVREVAVANEVLNKDGRVIYDFGDMLTGTVRIRVKGSVGAKIRVGYAEKCDGKQLVCPQDHVKGDYFQEDEYICCGIGEETWHAQFSYKGFRYVEISGFEGEFASAQVTALVMHNDVKTRGHFKCANPLINQIHQAGRTALLNNSHHIITDTPTYEKNGWTGDAQLTVTMGLYNFGMEAFYRKFVADIRDSQQESGEVAPIVPTSGWGLKSNPNSKWKKVCGPVPAWDAALFIMTWEVYQFSGDTKVINENYEAMKRYHAYLGKAAKKHIVSVGLGDWLPPTGNPKGKMNGRRSEGPAISSTAWYYKMTEILGDCAAVMGDDDCRERCQKLEPVIRRAFNERFLNEEKDGYVSGEENEYRQTSNILPLAFGLVPKKHKAAVLARLKKGILKDGTPKLDTGILGTRYLFDVLGDNGEVDLAYELITSIEYPSWGFWFANGHTSLGEAWELSSRSWSHHMFGSVDAWFYRSLAGIVPAEPGFKKVILQPRIPAKLSSAEASLTLPGGTFSSSWRKDGKNLKMTLVIPPGCEAELRPPASSQKSVVLTAGKHTIVVDSGKTRFEQN